MTTGGGAMEYQVGRLSLLVVEGDLRRICFDGVEVLRRVSYPVRDASWGTFAVRTVSEAVERDAGRLRYEHHFAARDGGFAGVFRAEIEEAHLVLTVEIDAATDIAVNRAGFTLLHPLRGVSGQALAVTHGDGSVEALRWPATISPGQPVFDIAGLAHEVAGVRVALTMAGEVFEMEDQRNWTDASYKTYCRPLALPLPFALGPDAPVRQRVELRLGGQAAKAAAGDAAQEGIVPEVAVAMEAGLAEAVLPGFAVQLRLRAGDRVPALAGPVHLEIVVDEGLDGLAPIAAACAGLDVARVTVLTAPYLKSHQPEGPWPDGPTPMALVAKARALFPRAAVGGGMFTNFTEFNRCRPDPDLVDFVTFGGTAVVHAADDMSVLETLEALPGVFASARGIARGKPLHLGLYSIGMRSNPYAADCVANPARERLAMVRDDPRQETRFAACFAAGVLAGASAQGVASVALAMSDGPLAAGGAGGVWPVYHVLRFARDLAGAAARTGAGGSIRIETARGSIIAVVEGAVTLPAGARGHVLCAATEAAARAADWLDGPPQDLGGVRLSRFDLAFLEGRA
ncbi:hypothetical protein [Paragemmobacter straminiformis]|uniref:Uncharacterized protein n=1 Tax=Paragemmobacter straminiformis TaxID=2045119 RepID=A0A842I4W0_9RHOB|nr:hypothetical protein [Gemmobacter straminiformis]MBC2834427.1 hypothetical protein [Gemmobacter straminiformis]